jgi:DNA repair exonuclease SbcCD ATPase subunit
MKLNSLQLRHFISHAATDLALNDARLTTFVGANGSGKSALAIDALRYALFDDARGRTDDLVQLGQNEMSVRAEISFAGAEYAITRGRSTKARGSSFLELSIRRPAAGDDAWRPLTGDTIRDTQAKIAELLRMDADTFDTAVLLGQGQANRFAEATAGDRKKILGTVLGLDLWERAETRTREEARDVEASTAADRATIARLEAELMAREALEMQRVESETLAASLEAVDRQDEATRVELIATMQGFALGIANGEAASREAAQRKAELEEQAIRYRRVSARKADAQGKLGEAQRAIAAAPRPDVTIDCHQLEGDVARLEAAEARDRELERAIATNSAALDQERLRFDAAVREHRLKLDDAARRVAELQADLAALLPVTCPKCNHSWAHDQAGLGDKLLAARTAVRDFPADPTEPMHFAVEAGKVERLRVNRRELAFDPTTLGDVRVGLRAALAAREAAARLDALRSIAETARTTITEAEAELTEIETNGKAARTALEEAEIRSSEGDALRSRAEETSFLLRTVESSLRSRAEDRRRVAGTIAQAAAALERLDRLAADRGILSTGLAESDRRLSRLRRLVQAFGVTGIPARIIESVLPELTTSANELLAQLRPGMVLDIRAQRAKKDGKGIVEALDLVVSDDVGERPLGLYSGGERMSVSLAMAVGLSRLVARRAGTAIRTLVIDEPDGLDSDARRSFGQALRILAHQGELERVLLVSHHQDLADVGDAVYQVTKEATGSHVEQIA